MTEQLALLRDVVPPAAGLGDLDRLAAALAAFQAELPQVSKTRTANTGTYTYKYSDLADLSAVVLPALAKHGLSFTAIPRGHELVGVLLHSSGQYLEARLPIGGNSPQAMGSAITYARRYCLAALTGVAADDDDDGQAASRPVKSAAKKTTTAAKKTTARPAGGITEAQTRLLAVLCKEVGLPDRDSALAYVTDVVGHPVSSRTELTSDEASRVIDALQRDAADLPPKAGAGA